MAIQNSGPISLADIAAEFGGSAPHSLSEYYGAASGIPASGGITMGDFYAASAVTAITLTGDHKEINLRSEAINLGWDGVSALEFVIDTGATCWSDDTNIAALTTGTNFPAGLTITNKGKIMGRGGNGGNLSNMNGGAGGPALELEVPVTIDNSQGYIGGGGGGGAATEPKPQGGTPNDPNLQNWTNVRLGGGGGAGGGLSDNSYDHISATTATTQGTFTLSANNTITPVGSSGTQLVSSSIANAFVAANNTAGTHDSTGGGNGGTYTYQSTIFLTGNIF